MSLLEGLVGWWTMDNRDTQGGVCRDRSGYGHHGTLKGGVTTSVAGKTGEAYSFDGTDDYIALSNGSQIWDLCSATNAITISFWGLQDNTSKYLTQFGYASPSNCWVEIYRDSTKGASFKLVDSGGTEHEFTSGWLLNSGEWNHYAFTYDGSTAEIYVNGDRKSSTSNSFQLLNNDTLHLASYNGSNVHPGDLDDYRIYNRALTADEVNRLMEIRTPRHTQV